MGSSTSFKGLKRKAKRANAKAKPPKFVSPLPEKKVIKKVEKIARPFGESERHICRSTAENADRPVFVHRDTI